VGASDVIGGEQDRPNERPVADPALVARLEARVRAYGHARAVVAVSGGVDSAVVLAVAARVLGTASVTAATAVSPSFPAGELGQARGVASSLGVRFSLVETGEVEAEAYARNDAQRCYHCKTELYSTLARVSQAAGADAVVLAGGNADDADDFRPGLRAAADFGVRNPLLEEGLRKDHVRAVARTLHLTVADRPAMACLSSRVAFGVRITPDLLARIDHAERLVRALGFERVRVRHHGERATVEVAPEQVGRLRSVNEAGAVLERVRALGWKEVEIDPRGYRSGSMNATLVSLQRRQGPPTS
jgi:uncharacterized protein